MSVSKIDLPALFNAFHPNSKVWIYASNREVTEDESKEIQNLIDLFAQHWTAHDQALKAAGCLLHNRFLILSVDQSKTHASGCSIDKSVHFIKSLETSYSIDFFNRLDIHYLNREMVKSIALNNLTRDVAIGEFSLETLIFDTTLTQLDQFKSEFIKEAGQSWLKKYLN